MPSRVLMVSEPPPRPQRQCSTDRLALTPSQREATLSKIVNARGMCTGAKTDPGLWFPEGSRPNLAALARRACAGCKVITDCRELTLLREAQLPLRDVEGIAGGLAAHERRAILRKQRPVRSRGKRGAV